MPSLDADENEYSYKCISKAKGLESVAVSPGCVEAFSQSREVSGINTDSFTPSAQDPDENTGRSMSSTLSTAIGTMAGASSVLALLYKFSPGGNWIRSGFRGSRGRINDNLYVDRENYLFFNELQGENISSYDTRYNIGYGSS
ncbi:Plasmodium vivax Vir protein, putative [Plasmodium vivax]|uniref:Vir protein, putative n=1 Tax=Plasmodium vivax TaxID=5855 RepID=A0A1G4GSD5_PLAVI|nr:Plasmodium vivax Vir protein, putative [Plasmodium vivax]